MLYQFHMNELLVGFYFLKIQFLLFLKKSFYSFWIICDKEITLSTNEATWMLLGLVVDTNNFTYRTTKQTFEVAALLNKYYASTAMVKNYLKESVDEKRVKSNLVLNAEYLENDEVAIAVQKDKSEPLTEETISKISDELLMTSKVKLAVTVGYLSINPQVIKMSARSLGDTNCQVLMEKFGGGGHYTQGAAQINDLSMEEVVKKLKKEIKEVIVPPEVVRVILLQDLKSKGVKGDIVELQKSYADELLNSGDVVLATPENLRVLEEENKEAEQALYYKKVTFENLKKIIEEKPINIRVETSEEGKLETSVTTKNIADEIDKLLIGKVDEKIDRKKIILNKPIDALGSYEAEIELSDDIFAVAIIHIIEK